VCILIVAFTFALAGASEEDSDEANELRQMISALQSQISVLKEKTHQLEGRLDNKQKAEILLYKDRKDCPEGYYPMENAFGRFIVIGGKNRGDMSGHTFLDERTINMPCETTIGVAESGFHRVCGTPGNDGSPLSVDLKELVPYVELLACSRADGDFPVIG
jgi:hypothetical protein